MRVLNSIVSWSLKNPALVVILSIAFLGYGLFSAKNLKMDAIPDITTAQVQVVTSAPSLSATEIEQYITFPVEWGLGGLPKLEEVRSISRYGISLVTLVFEEGTDIMLARQLVSERMPEIQSKIPQQYGTPEIAPLTTALGEVVQFTLTGDQYTARELTDTLQWYISPILKTVPGIVDVNVFGGEIKQYQIHINLQKIASLRIDLQDVVQAIENNNLSQGGGYIEKNQEHSVIGVHSLIESTKDIEEIAIKQTIDNNPILIKHIATVKEGYELRKGAATQDGKSEVVGGIALMLMGENSLEISQLVVQKLDSLKSSLPDGMEINIFYDRSEMVLGTIRTVLFNLGEGAILVILILLFMLGNIRSGLIIAIIIPLCMLFAISIMGIRDAPANLMSMGAVDFGLLVDGAVIVVENVTRRLGLLRQELGRNLTIEEKRETIFQATIEVRRATIFGEMIIGVVYIPILALSGTEGMLFRPMALTVLYALGGAFILTLTLVPVLSFFFMKEPKKVEEETATFKWILKKYNFLLDKTFQHKKWVVGTASGIFLSSLILFQFLGREFIPVLDEGSSLLEISRLPSSSLQESIDSGMRIERLLLSNNFPEITGIVSKTGSPNLALEPMGLEKTDVFIQLKPRAEWNRSRDELLEKISEVVDTSLPEVAFGISQPIEMRTNEMVAGIRSDIGVKIFGSDLNTLKDIAERTSSEVKKIPGVTDIRIEQLGGVSYIQIIPLRDKLSQYGISSKDISNISEMVSSGLNVGQVLDGAKKYNITLRMENPPNQHLSSWNNLLVGNNKGNFIPLGDLAKIVHKEGPAQISHEWQERRVLVEFNVRGRDVVSTVEDVKKILPINNPLPPGYRYEWDGTYKNYLSAMNSLYIIVPTTFVLIIMLLWFATNNIAATLLLFINIPFAITGGIFSLWLRDLPFSISAGVGFIALCGVAVLNSLVLVTFALNREETMDEDPTDSIYNAALLRVRPVVMTGLVAILGFLPMAVSTNPGAEVQRPLATVVIGGLISDGLLTLFVFPALYSLVRGRKINRSPD